MIPLVGRQRHVLAAALVGLALTFVASPALAQPCTADTQCRDGGRSMTYCSGNAVVTARSICAGSCRTVEESRVPCDGQCLAGRCTGQPSRAPVDPVLPKRPWPRCAQTCSCKNKILIIGIGVWTPERGCDQIVRRCARGCTCEPEPRCK